MNYENLQIVHYPDPRLKKRCEPVLSFDDQLARTAERMFQIMRDEKGVGLAAPQVGLNLRFFVMNHTGEPADDRVIVNPKLEPLDGSDEDEEGCLSIPGVRVNVIRADRVKLTAQNLDGSPLEIIAEGFQTRVWQHETDHLDGILLTDRLSFSEKMRHRKTLRDLEAKLAKKKT